MSDYEKIASFSVDLDSLDLYYGLMGLTPDRAQNAIFERAIPRFLELFEAHGIRATFFAVGGDLLIDGNAGILREAVARGHEIGNHTQGHRYNFIRLGEDARAEEILLAHQAISEAVGVAPTGFRAPGYNMTSAVFQALEAQGYRYDSSVFPAIPYYAAKSAAMAWIAMRGRRSAAVLGPVRGLLTPLSPYRPRKGRFNRAGGTGILELPLSVISGLRFPVIGSTLLLAGRAGALAMLKSIRRRRHINIGVHGIELLDAEKDQLDRALVARQFDLRLPLERKRMIFSQVLEALKGERRILPLKEAAAVFLRR